MEVGRAARTVIPDSAIVIPDLAIVIPDLAMVIPDLAMVIPDLIRDPVLRHDWIAGQARNDSAGAGSTITGAKPPPWVLKLVVWPAYMRAASNCTRPA